jgi:hypothetical protein
LQQEHLTDAIGLALEGSKFLRESIGHMQAIVYASFKDGERAEMAVGGLLDAGVAAEDISAVVNRKEIRESDGGEVRETAEGLAMVDSGETGELGGASRVQREGSMRFESHIGGGIATSTREDSVSGVEEMDDSQEFAENMSYPDAGSYSSQEARDVAEGANTGYFDTTKPQNESLYGERTEEIGMTLSSGDDLESLIVPGLGLVLGSGPLATAVLGAGLATESGGAPAASLADYLQDQGVEKGLSYQLSKDFEEGGAIIAVAAPVGQVQQESVETVLNGYGATRLETVETPT